MPFNGKELLDAVLRRAGYATTLEAVAEMTVFAHPRTVAQTRNQALFRVVRGKRGEFLELPTGIRVMADDNESPSLAILWAIGSPKYSDIQFNHIYPDSKNVDLYTSLANICITPAFLAKLTDSDDSVSQLLQYRVYDIYGFSPGGISPKKPEEYGTLQSKWRSFPAPIEDLEKVIRGRLIKKAKSRTAISARTLGWFFSGNQPDGTL